MYLLIFVIVLPSSVFGWNFSCVNTTVTLPQGRVKGTYDPINKYRTYLGIPYATVTERYQDPSDPPTWNGTFNAFNESICKQFSDITKNINGTEDCLKVNVFAPCETGPELFPVIIFIHGGSFYQYSNNKVLFEPKYMVKKKVVVVTINYRLGAFGFLCLRTKGAPGNVGLKDQIAAFKWVKNNIALFGGNPNSVTLFGQSAGAISVMVMILTQAATGLFHRAIIDSGTIKAPQFFNRDPIKSAAEVAGRLGYNTTDTKKLLEIFKNSTADDIVTASYINSTNKALGPYVFMLCKEDPKVSSNAIIIKTPQELLYKAKKISNISVILGFNNKEGIMWAKEYDLTGLKNLDENYTSAVPQSFEFDSYKKKKSFINATKQFYFKNSSVDYDVLIDYFSDALVMYPTVLAMEAFVRNPNITMYNYYFKYDSLRNMEKLKSKLRCYPGAGHVDELFYLFDPLEYKHQRPIPADLAFIDTMTSLWTSFARNGVPSAENVTWTPSSAKNLKFLKLDKKMEMIGLPNAKRIEFWRRSEENYGTFYP